MDAYAFPLESPCPPPKIPSLLSSSCGPSRAWAGSLGRARHGRVVLVLPAVAGDVDDSGSGVRVGFHGHELDQGGGGPPVGGLAVPEVGQVESGSVLGIEPVTGVGGVVLEGDEDGSDPLSLGEDTGGGCVQLDVVVGQLLGQLDF